MAPRTGILVALGALALAFGGIAYYTHQPATLVIITLVFPAWLRASGAVLLMAVCAGWFERRLWPLIDRLLVAGGL